MAFHYQSWRGFETSPDSTSPGRAQNLGWGMDTQKKTPLLFLAHLKDFTVGVQNWWSMAAPRTRRRLRDYLAEGRGHQIQLPHPQFLGEKEEENPRDGQSPREGWKSSRSRAWHRTLSPPVQRACPFSAPQLPTAAIHGRFSQCRGSRGPLGGQWSHARILGTCPLWPGSTKPPAGAASSPSQWDSDKWSTATRSVLQEVDKAGREDSGAGAIALDEADLEV